MSKHLCVALAVFLVQVTALPSLALEIGRPLGPVTLQSLPGPAIVMNNYSERPATAIVFLSARCDATAQSLDAINELHKKYRLRDVLFVGICANPAESAEELRTLAQHRGIIFPLYRDPQGEVARKLGATITPELYLLDGQGQLVFHGGLNTAEVRSAADSAIQSILKHKPIATATSPVRGTPIDRPGPKRAIESDFGLVSFSSELIFDQIPNAAVYHCSSLCQASNGDLLCLWYGGSYESADDQTLYLARRPAGERTWSQPQALLQNALQPPGNGVIFTDASGQVWIIWGRMEGTRPMRRGSGWDRCRLMCRTSSDHGTTWSEDRELLQQTVWCVPRNPPITLSDGAMVLPVEGIQGSVEGSYFLLRAAGKLDWRLGGFTSGGSQPAVIQRQDGSLLALMRRAPYLSEITSTDGGQSWSDARETSLKNPDAGISMTRLHNGHLVLVYNDSKTDRTPLSVCRSLDEGKTWEAALHLESNPGEYSYPCVIQSADGQIHVTYTFRRYSIKHVEFNEDWLVRFERPD